MTELTVLPDNPRAKLPDTYRAARHALSECSRLDECADWADKAEALASYARQAKDDSLRRMADRIQARAVRRCGELLKRIEPQQGARTDLGRAPTRSEAATEAGLSEHQRKTALRVASVPEADFEAQVESPEPPTVTQLAEQGRQRREQPSEPAIDLEPLKKFARFCGQVDPIEAAKRNAQEDCGRLRAFVGEIDSWLDRFVTHLRQEET